MKCLDRSYIDSWVAQERESASITVGIALSNHAPVSLWIIFEDFLGTEVLASQILVFELKHGVSAIDAWNPCGL